MQKFELNTYVDVYTNEGNFLAVGKVINYNEFREPFMAYSIDLITMYPDIYFAEESQLELNRDSEETIEKLEHFVSYMSKRREKNA